MLVTGIQITDVTTNFTDLARTNKNSRPIKPTFGYNGNFYFLGVNYKLMIYSNGLHSG